MRPRRLFPLTVAACLSMPFVIFAQPLYTVHDLGIGQPTGINNSGQVIGTSGPRGFRTAPNSVINLATDDLGSLCPGQCAVDNQPTGINSSG